ncbi:hypothetical protein ACJ41O_006638 [Fusarium nematophilum]
MRLTRSSRSRADAMSNNSDEETIVASPAAASEDSLSDTIVIPSAEDENPDQDSGFPSDRSDQPTINRSSLRQRRHGKAVRDPDSQLTGNSPAATAVTAAKAPRRPRCKPTKKRTPLTLTRIKALAGHEIARAEHAQERADRHARWRERAANSARVEEVLYFNQAQSDQESTQTDGNINAAESREGIRYERKAKGPFTGKLVSQGIIVTIDGEEHIEYRVLAKLS